MARERLARTRPEGATFEIPQGGEVVRLVLTTEEDQEEFLDTFYEICPRIYNEAVEHGMVTTEVIQKLCQFHRTEVRFVYERYEEKYVPWGGKGKPH